MQSEKNVDANTRIRVVGPQHGDLLTRMYDQFDPLGVALGLPPCTAEARRAWIGGALCHSVNLAAFTPTGEVTGHCFLAADDAYSAELAIFVHQKSRRRGIGRALVKTALQWGSATGLRRVWSLTSPDNRAALCLQQSCGFRVTECVFPAAKLEIDLAS